jgi:hypothetical protein
MTVFYLDPVNGADANDGSDWAHAWLTWTLGATAARIAAGDTIRIAKTADPVALGVNATWTNDSATVTLASALTKTVSDCDTDWTTVANVSQSADVGLQGVYNGARKFVLTAAFTTGMAAYKALAGATDFSAYTALTFWMKGVNAWAANTFRIDLCSDNAGTDVVDSFTINVALVANIWIPVRIVRDGGGNLGNSIQSVALYCLIDPGAPAYPWFYLDNIEACNSFSLLSFIGKSSTPQGVDFWPVRSILQTVVILGSAIGSTRYYGTTQTVATYRREAFTTTLVASTTVVNSVTDSGTQGNPIIFSGGWNTGTTLQDGETWYDGRTAYGYGIVIQNKDFVTLDRVSVARYLQGLRIYESDICIYQRATLSGNETGVTTVGTCFSPKLDTVRLDGQCSTSINMALGAYNAILDDIVCLGYASSHFSSYGYYGMTGKNWTAKGAAGYNIDAAGTIEITGTVTCADAATADVRLGIGGNVILWNATLSSATPVYTFSSTAAPGRVCLPNFGDTSGRHKAYIFDCREATAPYWAGIISDQITGGQNAAWARGGSGICVYLDPQRTVAGQELEWEFAIPCTASTDLKCHIYVKKTAAGATCTLTYSAKGCGIAEITDDSVALTDDWAEYTSATMSPTETGFITITLKALDGGTTGDIGVDDVHQAAP